MINWHNKFKDQIFPVMLHLGQTNFFRKKKILVHFEH